MKHYVLVTSFKNYEYFGNLLYIQECGEFTAILKCIQCCSAMVLVMEEMHASRITQLNRTNTCEALHKMPSAN